MDFTGAVGYALIGLTFVFGLVVGSFLNVVIFRLPREGLSVSRPRRSFCPNCHNQILWYDNLPIISWLFLKGRCRFCHINISFRYPLVELVAGLLAVFVYQIEGPDISFFFHFYFVMALVAIAFIDLELMVIPDLLVWPTFLVGLVSSLINPNPLLPGDFLWLSLSESGWNLHLVSLVGAALGFVLGFMVLFLVAKLYKIWRGQDGLGDGDPPLLGLIGVFLGWQSIFPVLLTSTLIALFSVGLLLSFGRFSTSSLSTRAIPFGPFLSLAALGWYFYGPRIVNWYWHFMLL